MIWQYMVNCQWFLNDEELHSQVTSSQGIVETAHGLLFQSAFANHVNP